MTQESMKTIVTEAARMLEDNLGNKLTVALANGLLGELGKLLQPHIEEPEEK